MHLISFGFIIRFAYIMLDMKCSHHLKDYTIIFFELFNKTLTHILNINQIECTFNTRSFTYLERLVFELFSTEYKS